MRIGDVAVSEVMGCGVVAAQSRIKAGVVLLLVKGRWSACRECRDSESEWR